ncbi:MAG: DUF3604 domain-containing protein [Myxococcota bacterium]
MWRRVLLRVFGGLLVLALILVGGIAFLSEGVGGERLPRGKVAGEPQPLAAVAARADRQTGIGDAAQVLFGDLHVHTTYSGDAFLFSLPLFQGEGAHPPADACDFARYCAELDFWSINDHAEFLTPWQWDETRESIRECNAIAGETENPDLVSFLGWEWTQSSPAITAEGAEPKPHYGHKNVILLDTADDRVPARPIGAGSGGLFDAPVPAPVWALVRAGMTLGDWGAEGDLAPYRNFNRFAREVRALDACAEGVPVRELPPDCLEGAPTPGTLFGKLDDWGYPSLVIPHGTTWGIHAAKGSELGLQLRPGAHDPKRQKLFEVYSGHGNSEVWRDLVDTVPGPSGEAVCAEPAGGYLPCCWRAGELIAERCAAESGAEDCDARAATARAEFLAAGPGPKARGVVSASQTDDWLDCGQLPGGFLPALDYRPGMSAQYGLALRDAEAGPEAGAFRYGFIASSDNHKARPGPGYKETARSSFSDAYGLRQDWLDRLRADPEVARAEATPAAGVKLDPARLDPGTERNASYYYTAGLVAVHASDRSREAIWEALDQRRVYGTSGPRLLLWFDYEGGDGTVAPMGSEVFLASPARAPRFRVRAAGAFEQLPGCPERVHERLSAERVARLCRNECYHPSDRRIPIETIEVVRIRPQQAPDEAIDALIEDPWKVLPCPGGEAPCEVTFEDPDYDGGREFVYYVRALQQPTPAVNGNPLDCQRDASGRCLETRQCPAGGPNFDPADNCLAPVRERAWSSPIWLRPDPKPTS